MPPSLLRRVVFIGLPLAVLATAIGAGVWLTLFREPPPPGDGPTVSLPPDPPPPDPRLSFATPFRNVAPTVAYVGDAACTSCHAEIARTFHAHPMGRSAEATGSGAPVERYEPTVNNPFTVGNYQVRVEKDGNRVRHKLIARDPAGGPLPEYTAAADIAVGSATRGRSYLTVQDGTVWQSPVSWYSATRKWDLSPGFDLADGGRRPITAECLFCHLDRVEPVPGTMNRYKQPLPTQLHIGCERCHGPGELHVAGRLAGMDPGRPDHTIVNPRHLPADLREDVCRQCHLQGQERVTRRGRDLWEYRPGLPLELFVTVFVRHPDLADPHRSVGQIEQMEKSKCFTADGTMGCISCHDPHVRPPTAAEADRHFRARCLTCHESKGCSLPVPERAAQNDSCFRCHMPRSESSNIAHTSVTDHRILRRPSAAGDPPKRPAAGVAPLVPRPPGPHAPPPEERDRDLGIAFARLAASVGHPALGEYVGGLSAERLTRSLASWPGDVEAWLALAAARAAQGEYPEALDAVRTACARAPDSERPLTRLSETAVAAGEFELAATTADRLVKMSPKTVEHHLTAATSRLALKQWPAAEAAARAALAIQPLHPRAHLYLAVARHHQGDAAGGRRSADTAASLVTADATRTAYLDWYRERTR